MRKVSNLVTKPSSSEVKVEVIIQTTRLKASITQEAAENWILLLPPDWESLSQGHLGVDGRPRGNGGRKRA